MGYNSNYHYFTFFGCEMDWLIYLILIAASAEDINERRVKNALMLLLAAAVLTELLLILSKGLYFIFFDRLVASLLTLACFVLHGVRSGGIGGADVKAASLLSLRSGLVRSLFIIPMSFGLMLIYSLIRKILKHPAKSAPYVPFLGSAYFAVMHFL